MGTKPLPLLPIAERASLAAWGSFAPTASDDPAETADGDAKSAGVWPSLLQGLCKAAQASMGLLATVDWSCRGVILHGLVTAPAHDDQWHTMQPTKLDPFIPGLSASVDLGSIWTITDGSVEGTDGSTAFLTRWLRRHGIAHVIYGVVAVQALRTTYLALGRRPETSTAS